MLRTLILNRLIALRNDNNDFSQSLQRWREFKVKHNHNQILISDFVVHHKFEDLDDIDLLDTFARVLVRSRQQM